MTMYAFDFTKPATLEAALEALAHDEAMALAGGQTLLPSLKARLNAPARLVSLGGIAALRFVRREGDHLVIGAMTTQAQIAREVRAHCPGLADLAGQIGDPAVRNRGTVGGSLANNDPSACWPAAALALGATIETSTRQIAAEDFFVGMFTTALEAGEIITAVHIPLPCAAAYAKFAQPASRFALAGVFVARFDDGVRVAVTGAAEGGVFRWAEAERALSADFRPEAMEGLTLPADEMIGDLHGTPEYRAHLVAVMTRRAVAAA